MDNENKKGNNFKKKAKEMFEKSKKAIVKSLDQNDDSSFDKEDLKLIKSKIGNKAKNTADTIKDNVNTKKMELDKKRLQPIFEEEIKSDDFKLPNIICLSDIEKKYQDSEVCKGAIGHYTDYQKLRIMTIFYDYVNLFNLTFEPNNSSPIYYKNPYIESNYIALGDYFEYINTNQVHELEMIASKLGATYFKVDLMEEKIVFKKESKEKNTSGKYVVKNDSLNVKTKKENKESTSSVLRMSKEDHLVGHDPEQPNLVFLKNDSDINNLINMRMKKGINKKNVSLSLGKLIGISKNEAASMDGAMKILKISGNSTFSNEYNEECRKYLEYTIEF